MSKKRYLEAETLKEFLRMGMKVGHIHTLRDVEKTISTPSQKLPRRKWPVNAGEIPSMTRRQKRMLTDSEESLFGEPRPSTLTSHIGRMQFFTLWTFSSGCRCL